MIESTDILAIVCLAAVVLTPPKRRRRFSRIQWSAYTERGRNADSQPILASESPSPRSAYAFKIGSVEAGVLPVPSPGERPPLRSPGHSPLDAA